MRYLSLAKRARSTQRTVAACDGRRNVNGAVPPCSAPRGRLHALPVTFHVLPPHPGRSGSLAWISHQAVVALSASV